MKGLTVLRRLRMADGLSRQKYTQRFDIACRFLPKILFIHIVHNKPVTPDGPVLMISQYCKIDSKKSNPRLAFKLLFMLFEVLAIESDNASIVSLTYVIDCLDVGIDRMMQFDPFLLKKAYTLAENCMPLKLKNVHILNIRREGFPIFNFFTAQKKVEDLLEYIPRDAVTIEYGGDNGHISEAVESIEQKLLAYKKHFLEDVHFGTNEDLRDGRKKEWELDELSGVNLIRKRDKFLSKTL